MEVSPVLAGRHPRDSEGEEEEVGGGGDEGVVHHPTVALLLALPLPLHLGDEDPGHPGLLPHLTAVLAQGAVQDRLAGPPAHGDVGEPDLDPLVAGADHLEPHGDVLPPAPPVQEDVPGGGEGELLHGIVAPASLPAPVLGLTAPLLPLLLPGAGHELVAEPPVEARHHGALQHGLAEGQAAPGGEITLLRPADPAAGLLLVSRPSGPNMETAVFSGRYISLVLVYISYYISMCGLQHNTRDIKTCPEVVMFYQS